MKQSKMIKRITQDLMKEFNRSAKKNMDMDMMIEELIDVSITISAQFMSALMFSLNDIYPKKLNLAAIYCSIHESLLEQLSAHGGKKSEATRIIRQKFRRQISETGGVEQTAQYKPLDLERVQKNGNGASG